MKKKIALLVMATLMFFAFGTTALAAEKNDIDTKYDLKTISEKDLPDGIRPLEFNSIEEADAFLSKIKNESAISNAIALKQKEEAFSNQMKENALINQKIESVAYSTATTYYDGVQKKTIPNTNAFLIKGVGVVRYKYSKYNTICRFESCTSFSADYEGVTTFRDYTLLSYTPSLLDANRTLGISFTGRTNYYLFIDGLIKYYTSVDTSWVEYYI